MLFLCLDVMTRNPDNQTICVGDKVVMNCGYSLTSGDVFILIAISCINGTCYGPPELTPPIPGLHLQYIRNAC